MSAVLKPPSDLLDRPLDVTVKAWFEGLSIRLTKINRVRGALANAGASKSCSGAPAVSVTAMGMLISGAAGAQVPKADKRPASLCKRFTDSFSPRCPARCGARWLAPSDRPTFVVALHAARGRCRTRCRRPRSAAVSAQGWHRGRNPLLRGDPNAAGGRTKQMLRPNVRRRWE